MLCRRVGISLPLALLVAVLAHGLCFGARHLPGTVHADSLLGTLAAGLALAALSAVFTGALRWKGSDPGSSAWPFAQPALLGVGGLAFFALTESAEGRSPVGGGSPTLAALAVAAAFVWLTARLLGAALTASGRALALLASAHRLSPSPAAGAGRGTLIARTCRFFRSTFRGRAPPLPIPTAL